jgi:type IX secretion system PorP/SprF family membrane protein
MARIPGFSIQLFLTWKKAAGLLAIICIFTVESIAQQTPVLSHYYYNPYLVNPSAAGRQETARAFFYYRQQWVGIPGSPQTQAFTVDGPLSEKSPVGLGLSVYNDQTDIVKRISAMVTGSYRININADQQIDFGLSFGIIRNTINFEKIRADISDPGILQNAEDQTAVDGNAGLTYHYKKFAAGFATEQLFERQLTYENNADFRSLTYVLVRHYLLSFQYDFKLNENLVLTPLAVVRAAQGMPSQFDLNVALRYRELLWGNVAYRHETGVGMSLGVNISNRFIVGYNYELPTSDLRQATSGSHEVMLGIRFAKRGSNTAPTQKAVRSKNVEDFKRSTNAQYEMLDELQQKNETLNQELAEYKRLLEQQNSELEKLKQRLTASDQEVKSMIENARVDLEKEKSFDKTYAYYLVIGAVKTFEEAKTFQKMILRETDLKTEIIQNESQTWYFIYSDELHTVNEARRKLKEIDKSDVKELIVGNPWVYKTLRKTP